ncbi:hypothetical protein BaRGS_00038770 [Batillaria attramentaria]|uniref:Uncharacterized protein n=1 Tax=Batillaria attramentaria TaxID=370345 RepID=A0ABD0J675_9CAEN
MDSDSDCEDLKSSPSGLAVNGEDEPVEGHFSGSDDDYEGLTQEEKDLRLAQRLQAQFDLADKLQMKVIRFKGSDNEYSLRKGHSQTKF